MTQEVPRCDTTEDTSPAQTLHRKSLCTPHADGTERSQAGGNAVGHDGGLQWQREQPVPFSSDRDAGACPRETGTEAKAAIKIDTQNMGLR